MYQPQYTVDYVFSVIDALFGTKYSRMDQVEFVEYSLLKNFTWSILEYFILFVFRMLSIITVFF